MRTCLACVHVSMAVAICAQTKGLRWEGFLSCLPLCVPVVLHQPLHQPLHCIHHCIAYWLYSSGVLLPLASPLLVNTAGSGTEKRNLVCAAVANPRPDIVFLVVARISNHNSGGCSGNLRVIAASAWFRGKPLTSGRSHVDGGGCAWSCWAPAWRTRGE